MGDRNNGTEKSESELAWSKPYVSGEAPSKRSGHTFTVIGTNGFLFGGCDASNPAGPTNSLYQLKMQQNFEWVNLSGEEPAKDSATPVARWMHSAVVYDKKFLVIFGGFHSSTNRLNDVWIYDTITMTWTLGVDDENSFTPRGNHLPSSKNTLAPPPRGGHSASVIENRMWVFGGYGGQGYSRRDFNDVFVLDLDAMEWLRVPQIKGVPPKARTGHTASVVNDKIYIFGGWNAVEQFSDLCILDTTALTWSIVETHSEPRWGHTACSVEAIPYWKVFYFGGSTGNLSESKKAQGQFSNSVMVLDSGTDSFDRPVITGEIPCPRSDTCFGYDSKGSRLVLFGGWANQWLGDIYTLDVGCVVGPPYAIMGIHPTQGPITGGTELTIKGIDFIKDEKDPRIKVRFVTKRGGVIDVPAQFVDKETITCVSPNFDQVAQQDGEVEVDVRVAFKDDSFTTTFQKFRFLTVTDAECCLAFGPGVLSGGCPGVSTSFVIHANDFNGELRSTGGDEFEVTIRDDEDRKVNHVRVEDNDDGTYLVEYEAESAGTYTVEVNYLGIFQDVTGQRYDSGKSGPIRGSPFIITFTNEASKAANNMSGPLLKEAMERKYQHVRKFVTATRVQLEKAINPNYAKELASDVNALLAVKEKLYEMETDRALLELDMDVYERVIQHLQKHHNVDSEKRIKDLNKLRSDWDGIVGGANNMVEMANAAIKPHVQHHGAQTKDRILEYESDILSYEQDFKEGSSSPFYLWETGPDGALRALNEATETHEVKTKQTDEIRKLAHLFEFPELCENINQAMQNVSTQISQMRTLWEVANDALIFFDESKATLWRNVQPDLLEDEAKKKFKLLKSLHKDVRWTGAFHGLEREVKNFLVTCPLIAQLGSKDMRDRHWKTLKKLVGREFTSPDMDDSLRLSEVLDLNLHEYATEVEDIADQANKEAKMETALSKLEKTWNNVRWLQEPVPGLEGASVDLIKISEEDFETLEADQLSVQGMMGSRFVGFFLEPYTNTEGLKCKGLRFWQKSLAAVSDVNSLLDDIQRTWSYLEPLFIQSEEVKKALPEDAERFKSIDTDVRGVLQEAAAAKLVLKSCTKPNLVSTLEEINTQLEICKKSLVDFLDTKRTLFPRFYFTSEADLLDILSNGSSPEKIMKHITKVFLATKTFELDSQNRATHWVSCVGQEVGVFEPPVPLTGKVERYLQDALEGCKTSMQSNFEQSLTRYSTQQRCEWLLNKSGENMPTDLAQISLLVAGVVYVQEVETVFEAMKSGNRNAMQDYHAKQKQQLADLIQLTLQKLDKGDRQRVMCLITMDAHSRDIVDKLIREQVTTRDDFQWQSQLKQRVGVDKAPKIEICDAKFDYGFEYLGNGPRLVITPLTDRIYVTATQALHLQMGCAPAGPAGTGKTETTKDLAAGLGKCCYVFNCAPEMDYRSMGNIFKGLAASGSWGCFDEFNRLIPEVLSVCTVQFKAVCDGIRANTSTVVIEDSEVSLDPTCGVFITMNPGYLGRSELPEGLKALFRPMTVMVPDLVLICENMLMAEGFVGAKELASKFFGLYSLCKELLSKQAHYDWGLRAVKSVLVVAGAFKRAEPELHEEDLLLRALRDFNIPKIVQQDQVIFYGLLNDLFPGRNPQRKVEKELEEAVKEACGARELWPDDQFLLKVVQLEELLSIRHCVFIMGPPAAGKTECWRTLQKAHQIMGQRTVVRDINPKTQDAAGLYGYISMATREWRDGLLSKVMRDLGNTPDTDPKWIVLDGDLDANWIESMNSVMDDNKMLTLASNERIPLLPHMRMIFEIRDLAFATPATTSRAGIIFLSTASGSQWKSLIAAWIQRKEWDDHIKEVFSTLFTKYVHVALEEIHRRRFKTIINVESCSMVSSLLSMLDSMIATNEQNLILNPADAREATKVIEPTFVFCTAWALGSAFSDVDGVDYRAEFSEWWKSTFKTVKFPSRETVFDYFLDPESDRLEMWKNSPYFYNVDFDPAAMSMTNVTVPTPETAYVSFWMERMVNLERPMMLVGAAGCGKTAMVRGVLRNLNQAEHASTTINFNFYTNAVALQRTMEGSLEKKMGNTFGPPGQGNLIYFLDDLNLPEVDPYNTQDAIALLRQHIDYGHIYDRQKLTPKKIQNCQYLACMNHTAGSFTVNPRLQRHFVTFAIGFPGPTSLLTIYQTFLDGHLKSFDDSIKALSSNLINGALGIHTEVVQKFRKTAVNFHYEFNIRHLSNVFQGLLVAQPQEFTDPAKFIALWLHESERVYGDRLVSADDMRKYKEISAAQAKRRFPNYNMAKYFAVENADPLIFCHFAPGQNANDRVYDQVTSMSGLRQTLVTALQEYNEENATMDLVLFEDAVKHVCRISRIIQNPGGHAMLVGVGGSGKQSLSRLAAHMCGYETSQIVITPTYGIADFKEDLKTLYAKTGLKGSKIMFLFTDAQISDERVLVYLNDLLSSGKIPDLYTSEEIDTICQTVFNKVKLAGLPTDPASCYDFFINTIRDNLHCVLCFSPVGDDFRARARKFPALVNCTVIDWFQPWPQDALLSVARSFLAETELDSPEVRAGIEQFMPFSYESVTKVAADYKQAEKRFVHTTPKSYLELLGLYTSLLQSKRQENRAGKQRLENGLKKLRETAEIVTELEQSLKVKLEEAEEKKAQAEAQAEEVERESELVARETEAANVERAKCDKIAKEVQSIADDAQKDLEAAEPLVKKALDALDTLNKKDLGECKSMSTPPKGVDDVFNAVMILLAGIEPKIQLTKSGKPKNLSWEGAKKEMMGNVNEFLNRLKDFKDEVDAFRVPKQNWVNVRPLLQLEHFDAETIEKKNKAAGGIASWVLNIVNYYDTIVGVEPKRQALTEAEQKLANATEVLETVNKKVHELETKLSKLKADLKEATEIKQAAINEVETGQRKLDLAQRLTTALASENVRWAANIEEFETKYSLLTGDVLLASAFISYIGPFSKEYRDRLLYEEWIPFLRKAAAGESIPMSEDLHPVSLLASPAVVAGWQCDGLPHDSVSTDNGAITQYSARWPLIIDPQLQGTAWIQSMERNKPAVLSGEKAFTVIRMESKELIPKLTAAIENGEAFFIENISSERIDAAIMPVVKREMISRGSKKVIKLGDTEVVYNPSFRLYLHTKLSNPHFPPEIQAECTLVNFMVTQKGLEEQLLSLVVRKERPDLAEQRAKVIQQQNRFTVRIKELEDNILASLANAEGDICSDVQLIEGLEDTKRTANEIAEKSETAIETQKMIQEVSEKYRSVAARGALLFFLMNNMYKLHSYYIYSLNAFVVIFLRGIDLVTEKKQTSKTSMMDRLRAAARKVIVTVRFNWNEDLLMAGMRADESNTSSLDLNDLAKRSKESLENQENNLSDEEISKRCTVLEKSITETVHGYLRRGLFDKDNLTVASQLCFKILLHEGVISAQEVKALVTCRPSTDPGSMGPLSEWMAPHIWARVKGLEHVEGLETLGDDIMTDSDDWGVWYDQEKPEDHKMPGSYANLPEFKKLLLFRAMRPDRMNDRLTAFIEDRIGATYVERPSFDIEQTYMESSGSTPILFVLSPGVDASKWVEYLRDKYSVKRFSSISMGQGQEKIAEEKLRENATAGGWVMLENIHLMPSWLPSLERLLEELSQTSHSDFRCFLSAEPPAVATWKNIPESLLQSCIKVCNEPPADLKSNLRGAWASFSEESVNACSKPKEYQQCLFALSFFHSVVLGRRKFGPVGWSRPYSFSSGDLEVSSSILRSYISEHDSIPFDDLRYILGEIIYGGLITDSWDRRTCNTYLQKYLVKELVEGKMELAPGFEAPSLGASFKDVEGFIEKQLPKESPGMFGLSSNAEINYLTSTQQYLFDSIFNLGIGSSENGGSSLSHSGKGGPTVRQTLREFASKLPACFDLTTLEERAAKLLQSEQAPFVVVCTQECSRMNNLLVVMRESLDDLQKGLDGALNMSEAMEELSHCLASNLVPPVWAKHAWPSLKRLTSWFEDLLERVNQLRQWSAELQRPLSVWLPGLFNPSAFLTAVMQVTSRRSGVALDRCTIETHATTILDPSKITPQQVPSEGAFVHGLYMEGARYSVDEDDDAGETYNVNGVECAGYIVPSKLKQLLAPMPVMFIRAVEVKPQWESTSVGFLRHDSSLYEAPVYSTARRGPDYVFLATLRSREPTSRWVLAGAAIVLQSPE